MSQFDFPRINFYGKCLMDPATANNGWYLPLVYFDPVTIEVFLPPRVYLQDEYLNGKTLEDIEKILPEGATIVMDNDAVFAGYYYVEIATVSDEPKFREWARTPLGQYSGDLDYAQLYEAVHSPVNKGPLTGSIPGYWNYYGSMKFQYLDVKVSSIATGIAEGKEVLVDECDDNAPDDLKGIIGAKLTMNTDIHNDATNASVMIDTLPTMSMYSQIFTDKLSLHKGDEVCFSGVPCKSSLRLVNCFRVTNQNMPFGGSGVFVSTIPTCDLECEDDSGIIKLFEKYGKKDRKLKGILVYQVVSEVEENRSFDYRTQGNIPNPAYSILSGRLAPWYEGEMRSWTIARQLIGDNPYIVGKNADYDAPVGLMTPALFNFDTNDCVLKLDFLNNFPIQNKGEGDGPFSPSPIESNSYEVYPLGEIEICLEDLNKSHEVIDSISLGSVSIHEDAKSREQLYKDGGMYVIPIDDDVLNACHKMDNWNLSVYAQVKGARTRIMTESPIVVMSDQAGLHCNQGDDPARGYLSYNGQKEQCILRIFDRGRPVTSPIEITFAEYKMSSSGAIRTDSIYRIEKYKDGDRVTFDTSEPRNAIYQFIPYRTHALPHGGYPSAVVQTGFFVSQKVLHRHDYAIYLDPTNSDYPQEVTFQVLYDNLFRRFGLMAPTMNFHAERFDNPTMANEVLRRIQYKNWDKSWYMPPTRDISEDQIELVKKWVEAFRERDGRLGDSREFTNSDKVHEEHLSDKLFFNK